MRLLSQDCHKAKIDTTNATDAKLIDTHSFNSKSGASFAIPLLSFVTIVAP
jgi:hypothetical protein